MGYLASLPSRLWATLLALHVVTHLTNAAVCAPVLVPSSEQLDNSITITFSQLPPDDWTNEVGATFRRSMLELLTGSPTTNTTYINQCSIVSVCVMDEFSPQNKNYTGNLAVSFLVLTGDGIYPRQLLLPQVLRAASSGALDLQVWPLARPPVSATSLSCTPVTLAATASNTKKEINWATVGTLMGAGGLIVLMALVAVVVVYSYQKAKRRLQPEFSSPGSGDADGQKDATLTTNRRPLGIRMVDLGQVPRDVDVDRDSLSGSFTGAGAAASSLTGTGGTASGGLAGGAGGHHGGMSNFNYVHSGNAASSPSQGVTSYTSPSLHRPVGVAPGIGIGMGASNAHHYHVFGAENAGLYQQVVPLGAPMGSTPMRGSAYYSPVPLGSTSHYGNPRSVSPGGIGSVVGSVGRGGARGQFMGPYDDFITMAGANGQGRGADDPSYFQVQGNFGNGAPSPVMGSGVGFSPPNVFGGLDSSGGDLAEQSTQL